MHFTRLCSLPVAFWFLNLVTKSSAASVLHPPPLKSIHPHIYAAAKQAHDSGASTQESFRTAAAAAGRVIVRQDTYGGEGFFVKPLVDTDKATIVILHGVSGNGQEWGYIALCISYLSLNYVRFVLPTAPKASLTYKNNEITNSWFDITLIHSKKDGFTYVDEYVQCNTTDMEVSRLRIENILLGEVNKGIPASRIFLLGFSQGGALAYTVFMKTAVRLGGLMGIATWMPLQESYPADDSGTTKGVDIFMQHGREDPVVEMTWVRASQNNMARIGRGSDFELITYPGLGHALVTAEVITKVEEFVKARADGETDVMKNLIEKVAAQFTEANDGIKDLNPENGASRIAGGNAMLALGRALVRGTELKRTAWWRSAGRI